VVNFNKEAWLFGFAAKIREVPVVARHGFPLLRKGIYHRILLTFLLDKLIVNAKAIKEWYRALELPVDDIDVIHNGTAMVTQKHGELRKRFDVRADEMLVLGAGRLESQKRFDRLIDVAAGLATRFQKLRVLIAGDGVLKDQLSEQIRTRGLENIVQLTGFIPDLAEVVGDADLFLLTSEEEGTPNVLLEAMAAGVSCISFGVGAVPQIFAGSLADNIITPGDVSAMTERATTLLRNSDLRAQIASQMKARVIVEFSLDISMTRFERIFQETISGRS
jgi:glycosyltransferase involved in cell wall biosynthesis